VRAGSLAARPAKANRQAAAKANATTKAIAWLPTGTARLAGTVRVPAASATVTG
jgi:hypothetical protein